MQYLFTIISLFILLISAGCTDTDLPIPGEGPQSGEADEAYTLTFTAGLAPMGSDGDYQTRAIYYGNPEYYEDWIDTQNGLRVLFFISKREKTGSYYIPGTFPDDDNYVAVDPKNPLKDYFLFESKSRWVTQLPTDEAGNLRYQITVPLYAIGQQDEEFAKTPEDWKRIRDCLRKYNFKIAILANHLDGTSQFTWIRDNSVLKVSDIDNLSGEKIKTINDIHHSVADVRYTSTSANRNQGYDMLVDYDNKIDGTGTMGPYIDWVIDRSHLYGDALGGVFVTKETARTWIRDYWIPDLKYNEDTDPDIKYRTLYHNYRHIWSYWNFGGTASDNAFPYKDKSKINTHLKDWEVRNGAFLRKWLEEAFANNGVFLKDLSTASNEEEKLDGSMPLTFHPEKSTATITTGSDGKRFYGVKLPQLSSAPTSMSAKDVFHFKMNAHGTVVVRHTGGTVNVRFGTSNATITRSTSTKNGMSVTELVTNEYTVPDQPVDCYVYSSSGTPIVYDIEMIEDQYVYLTDREGVLPSSDHPIPMYGVQKYEPLEGYWEEGASFNLTTGGINTEGKKYNSKTISLLRAVAKIELLVPKSIGVPKHVYMHSLNRNVRCQPMDVSTPTNEIWKEHKSEGNQWNENECEWKLIQDHGPFIKSDQKYETNDYKTKMAWYYGAWLEWGWHFNNKDVAPTQYDGPFPRVMNPFINRADCAAFIDLTDYYNDEYYHYVFYMGENPVDACSSYDGSSGSPMVPHIRLRFDERYASTSRVATNSDLNLMGRDCYRIYMTEGGIVPNERNADGSSKKTPGTDYSSYDSNSEYLKQHWPVMRNHIYRFKIKDTGSSNMNALVVESEKRSVDFDFE